MFPFQRNVDRWLFEEYRTETDGLGLYRIAFASYVLLAFLPLGLWVGNLPPMSFSPPVGLAAMFLGYPPQWVLLALNALTMCSVCALVIGWHTVAASLGTSFGIAALGSFAYADGKIDHSILLILTPLTLAWSGWGASFSVDARNNRSPASRTSSNQPWLTALLAMLIGFALLTGGLGKIHGGWLRPSSLATKWHLLSNYRFVGRETPLGFWAMGHFPTWAWKWMDWSTVLWETGFILSVPWRTSCRVACAFGALFHVGVWLLFDITFSSTALTYGAFVSWASLRPAWTEALRARLDTLSRPGRLVLCSVPFVIALISLAVFQAAPNTRLSLHLDRVILVMALVVATVYVGGLLKAAATWAQAALSSQA